MSLIPNNIWVDDGITLVGETAQKDRRVSVLQKICTLRRASVLLLTVIVFCLFGWLGYDTPPIVKLMEMRKHGAAAVRQMSRVARPDSRRAPPTLDEAQQRRAAPLDSNLWPRLDFQKSAHSDSLQACVNGRQKWWNNFASHRHERAKRWTTHSLKCCIFQEGGVATLGGVLRRRGLFETACYCPTNVSQFHQEKHVLYR